MKNTKYIKYLIFIISIFVLSNYDFSKEKTIVVERKDYLVRNTSLSEDRFTYYVPGVAGTGNTTATGLNTDNFSVNENGWYTYNGKVVLAAAFYNCDQLGVICVDMHTGVKINYNGKIYDGIVLDKCGACSTKGDNRIDIFASTTNLYWPTSTGKWSATGEKIDIGNISNSNQGSSLLNFTTSYSGDLKSGWLYKRLEYDSIENENFDANRIEKNMDYAINVIFRRSVRGTSNASISGPGLSSADPTGFRQRLSAPTQNGEGSNFYFTNSNASYRGGYLGQCTWYAYGRANEILSSAGSNLTWNIASNAGLWYDQNLQKGSSGFKSSNDYTKPKVGAIISWKKNGAPGHVAVVEAVNSDGTVTISEANVGSVKSSSNPYGWQTVKLTLNEVNTRWGTYKFSGYIYMLD